MIEKFLENIKNNKTNNTEQSYRYELNKCFPDKKMNLSISYLRSLVNEWQREGKSHNSIIHSLSCLHTFVRWVNQLQPVKDFDEIAELCKSTKKLDFHTVMSASLNSIIKIKKDRFTPTHYNLIFDMMFFLGLKVSEIVNLNVGHIKNGFLLVEKTDNAFFRVYMPTQIYNDIMHFTVYLKRNDAPLFAGKGDNRLSVSAIQKRIATYAQNLDLSDINCDNIRNAGLAQLIIGINTKVFVESYKVKNISADEIT